ncbi:hypothetical protein RvY_07518 [Ramazzottius varieornatus]|uniref:Uncharacterized protein n=1 Tax=Ramazzottius varieornatus TaxID=947166 RepID=A0A1D1V509_RAMVA|nr:hypothetical protein RvY_07518 [Ramazzottius varieornatus]
MIAARGCYLKATGAKRSIKPATSAKKWSSEESSLSCRKLRHSPRCSAMQQNIQSRSSSEILICSVPRTEDGFILCDILLLLSKSSLP